MSYIQEEWKPIDKVHGTYAVSSFGRVRREIESPHAQAGRHCKQRPTRSNYPAVSLYCKVARKHYFVPVHQLVAAAFIGPRPDGFEVNHIDGNKHNNYADNLQYVSRADNLHHAIVNALHRRKLSPDDVRAIRLLSARHTGLELAKRFGVGHATISRVLRRQSHAWVE